MKNKQWYLQKNERESPRFQPWDESEQLRKQ